MDEAMGAVALFFGLLNPFLLSIYLIDLIRDLPALSFARVLSRGAFVSILVFAAFCASGDALFSRLLNVHFASFQVFGGLVLATIGLRFVLKGTEALEMLRGRPEHLAGSIAMPFMIGPGTVSASILVGNSLPVLWGIGAITFSVVCTILAVILFKVLHDHVARRNATLIQRYIEVVGRFSGMVTGTIAIEMVINGGRSWWQILSA